MLGDEYQDTQRNLVEVVQKIRLAALTPAVASPISDGPPSVAGMIASLTEKDQLAVLREFLTVGADSLPAMLDEAWEILAQRKLWRYEFDNLERFKKSIDFDNAIKPLLQIHEKRIKGMSESVQRSWGNNWDEIIPVGLRPQKYSRNLLERLAKISKLETSINTAMKCVQIERDARVSRNMGGNSSLRFMTVSDVDSAIHRLEEKSVLVQAPLLPYPDSQGDPSTSAGELAMTIMTPTEVQPRKLRKRGRIGNGSMKVEEARGSSPPSPTRKLASNTACCCKEVVIKALGKMHSWIGDNNGSRVLIAADMQDLDSMCHFHLRQLCKVSVGLRNSFQGSTRKELLRRLRICLTHITELDQLRSRKYDWFIGELQQNNVRRELGDAKYAPRSKLDVIVDSTRIWKRFSAPGDHDSFLRDGTVNVSGVFSYLFEDPAVTNIIDLEFEMYRHHYHPDGNAIGKFGWLRNMWYSLVQQVVRQDPVYYSLMVAARPDRNWMLISYPYYTKYTEEGESTGFTHLDINVQRLCDEGIGLNSVQGCLSLDDETSENCTLVVKGFHNEIRKWYKCLLERKSGKTSTAGETTDMNHRYTNEDAKLFGSFEPVPCQKGGIRITRADIAHGSTSRAPGVRRAIFPWYTGINDDHESLEDPNHEEWSEVAACHRDRVYCRKGPAGTTAISYRKGSPFSATISLPSSSPIGAALVGRLRWTLPEVIWQIRKIFGDDETVAMEEVRRIREKLLQDLKNTWITLQEVEEEVYGDRSFFLKKRTGISYEFADGCENDFSTV